MFGSLLVSSVNSLFGKFSILEEVIESEVIFCIDKDDEDWCVLEYVGRDEQFSLVLLSCSFGCSICLLFSD